MKRSSGVLMRVTCLPGDHSAGSIGAAAREWIDLLSECGFSYWQVLPFCLPDEYNSPYKSYSAFSGNPNFIDLEQLVADGLITTAFCSIISATRATTGTTATTRSCAACCRATRG